MNSATLKKQEFIIPLNENEIIADGSFFLRCCGSSLQTGMIKRYYDENSVIAMNVIDLRKNEFVAEEGFLNLNAHSGIHMIDSFYNSDEISEKALNIIKNWSLFSKYPAMRLPIIKFVKNAYAPKLVLHMKNEGCLSSLFIPIQQKFRIGRFSDNTRWEDSNRSEFRHKLENLNENDYLTYIGYMPQHLIEDPMFFSVGKISHLETDLRLKKEPFLYNANCGGNIRFLNSRRDKRYFLVDAGASHRGNGVNSTEENACEVIVQLKKMYPEFNFLPASGRNALGGNSTF